MGVYSRGHLRNCSFFLHLHTVVLNFITYNSFYWEGAKQPEMIPKNKKKQIFFSITESQCRPFISCFKGVEYVFHSYMFNK